mmetsp:Transcript_2224/g.3006  ORF Transcript_2224/g.3006 Transcript_2224/m.3006 type:complete len:457 (-) Transcript_2224:260-1630(-)
MDLTSNQLPYCFPLLKNQEILDYIGGAGIELSQNEIMEPNRHKEKVKSVFIELIHIGLGIPEDTFTSTSMLLMKKRQSLPYPELHEESFNNLKFLKACMKLMRVCGIQDFGFADLHAPTSKRFRRQLSGFINYGRFIGDRESALFVEINNDRDELIAGFLEMKNEQKMLKEQLNQVQADAEKRWHEANDVDDECGEIGAEIAKQNKLQASIREESLELKKKANMLKDKIATIELQIQEMEGNERKLAPQIVESPDLLNRDIADLGNTLDEEMKYCDNAEQDSNLAELRVKNVMKAQNDVADATNLTRQVSDDKNIYDRSNEEAKAIEKDINISQATLENHMKERDDLEKEICRIEEKTLHFRKQAKTKMDTATASLHAANAEMLFVEKDRRDASSKVEQNEQEVQLLKSFIEEEKVKTDKEIEQIISTFKKFEQIMLEEQSKFDAVITKPITSGYD